MGWPLRLKEHLWSAEGGPSPLTRPKTSASGMHRERWELWKLPQIVTTASDLVQKQVTPDWRCDIGDVDAVMSSKSSLENCANLDEFAVKFCSPWCRSESETAIEENMRHGEVRIDDPKTSDHFVVYEWDGRLILSNDGGSHHFATARYISRKLGVRRQLCGALHRYSLNRSAVSRLTNNFHIFLLADDDRLWPLMGRLQEFGSKQYTAPLPWPCDSQLALIFPRDDERSARSARLLLERGFFDLGAHLKSLCS